MNLLKCTDGQHYSSAIFFIGLVRLTICPLAGVFGGCEGSDHRTAFTSDLKNVLVLEFNKCFVLPHLAKSLRLVYSVQGPKLDFVLESVPGHLPMSIYFLH